jgi:hypothetical protein
MTEMWPTMAAMAKRRWIVTAVVAAVLAAGATSLAIASPALAATACPECYGLSSVGAGAYAEQDDLRYRQILGAADQQITMFYGSRLSHPRVLLCATDACYRRIGGGREKGQAIRSWSLLLSPAGLNVIIATHELSHVEFHYRLGAARSQVPPWFDEGLAVVVSNDKRYLGPPGQDRCRLPYEQALTITTENWHTASANGDDTPYLKAACVVSRWLSQNGGSPAVLKLIAGLKAGRPFDVP